jgi:hypothetical protein
MQDVFPTAASTRRLRIAFWTVSVAAALAAWSGSGSDAWGGKVMITGPPTAQKNWDCVRCNTQAQFMRKMQEYGVSMDFLELRNGVAVLYSTADMREVPRVQRNAEWARDELTRISVDPDHYHLCSYCKASRAVFSKVEREVVRTASGAMFLMRSDDPEAVRALKDMLMRARSREAAPAPSR